MQYLGKPFFLWVVSVHHYEVLKILRGTLENIRNPRDRYVTSIHRRHTSRVTLISKMSAIIREETDVLFVEDNTPLREEKETFPVLRHSNDLRESS